MSFTKFTSKCVSKWGGAVLLFVLINASSCQVLNSAPNHSDGVLFRLSEQEFSQAYMIEGESAGEVRPNLYLLCKTEESCRLVEVKYDKVIRRKELDPEQIKTIQEPWAELVSLEPAVEPATFGGVQYTAKWVEKVEGNLKVKKQSLSRNAYKKLTPLATQHQERMDKIRELAKSFLDPKQ